MIETPHALRNYPLWASLPEQQWEQLSKAMTTHEFAAGETIFPHPNTDRCLCLLLRGRARVYSGTPDPAHRTLLRTMEEGALFGVHSIFCDDVSPQSQIFSERACRVLAIPASVWENILAEHPPTMAAYVSFLTRRVQFLNRKIQYLTAGCAERRLALYLLSEIPLEDTPTHLSLSAVAMSDLLDLGRASLYRALDRLCADGFLERNGHEYTLHRRDELLSHYS